MLKEAGPPKGERPPLKVTSWHAPAKQRNQQSRAQPCPFGSPHRMTKTAATADAWHPLLAAIADAWPPARWRNMGVVVGCSGGADSVGLLLALCQLREFRGEPASEPPRGFLVAAHFNHARRGAESDADEAFVRDLASRNEIRFASRRSTQPRHDEATMRRERLDFLVDAARESGARCVALAHSADDNVETVLHHLMRGTGPAGIAGIGRLRSIHTDLVLVRPLLQIRRDAIRDGLKSIDQSWREDASNADIVYRRNWIRHQLIPLIQSEYPHAVDAIGRAVDGQRGWRDVIDRLAREWIASHQLGHQLGDTPLLLRRDQETETAILVAAMQALWTQFGWSRGEMTREHYLRLAITLQSEHHERYTLPGDLDVIARGERVEIGPNESKSAKRG